ncbi:PREDICTED: beta-galactosidase-1-like protein 2 [Propithecus coquereli]|uniref:beta-galactosidase-1-like protein 2 n=1 Tax=Propithecus coquereli TaxID=379532 RepID=UPI00063EF4D7|nr:PREDICTED: beta-galactosidase-1-like protein 2 [Propithecus coquereli]
MEYPPSRYSQELTPRKYSLLQTEDNTGTAASEEVSLLADGARSMWAFLARLEYILCLSAFSVMAQLQHDLSPRINQTHLTPSQLKIRKVGLKVEGSNFTLEGFPFLIVAGTMHYFRVPRSYWRVNLLKLKACGFNTLTTAFITMASEVGLWVILCPGPYIGSDLDLGGLPSWLLKDPKMKLRTMYKGFTNAVNRYFDKLISRIVPLQYNQGGPIIAVQVENEYGSYYLDKKYMSYVKKALVKRGIKVLLMTADSGLELRRGHVKDVLATVHMKNIKQETYRELSSIQGRSPIMMMVYTASSFDTWGALRNRLDPQNYGALLTEDGEYTPEYITFQEYFSSVLEVPMSIQPDHTQKTVYKSVTLLHFVSLWEILPYLDTPIKSAKPVSMEMLSVNQGSGQSYGYTLYETYISKGGILSSRGHVRDRAQGYQDYHSLRILVENQGRLAYGKDINRERKGLTGDIYLDNSPLRKFTIYSLDMNIKLIQRIIPKIWKPVSYQVQGPAFFLGFLKVGEPKDTFIKLEGWTKGVVFINGKNLGRYWNLGPQETLYLPGPWLHSGTNEIVVFEELIGGLQIQFIKSPFLVGKPLSDVYKINLPNVYICNIAMKEAELLGSPDLPPAGLPLRYDGRIPDCGSCTCCVDTRCYAH